MTRAKSYSSMQSARVTTISTLLLSACGTSNVDTELRAELLEMGRADQEVRDRFVELIAEGGPDVFSTQRFETIAEEMAAIDRANQLRLDAIVAEAGWPGAAVVGDEAAAAALIVLEHADIEMQQRYLPMLRKAVTGGDARASSLAQIEDELSIANTGAQIYGTEISVAVDGVATLVQIIDPAAIDQRRAAMGLPPISEYLDHAEAELGIPVDRSALGAE